MYLWLETCTAFTIDMESHQKVMSVGPRPGIDWCTLQFLLFVLNIPFVVALLEHRQLSVW